VLAVEPSLSDFVEELVVKIFLLSPVVEVSRELSKGSRTSNLGKRGLSERVSGKEKSKTSSILTKRVLKSLLVSLEVFFSVSLNSRAVVGEPLLDVSLLGFNLVLLGVRVIEGGIEVSDLESVHLGGDKAVALTPELVVGLLELSAYPSLSGLGHRDLVKRSAALILQLRKSGVSGKTDSDNRGGDGRLHEC
jgi:hypothetical protein